MTKNGTVEKGERRMIIGVDYGTTYSGKHPHHNHLQPNILIPVKTGVSYAWSDAGGIEDVLLFAKWGKADRRYGHQKQVPSKICYNPALSWGHLVPPGSQAFTWTKLLLDKRTKLQSYDDASLGDANSIDGPGLLKTPPGKEAVDVVADYLTELYKHVMTTLENDPQTAAIKISGIDFWFTVPAVWSIEAQELTRTAANRAGFGSRKGDTFHMIKEPEAAVIASLNSLIANGPSPLVQVRGR